MAPSFSSSSARDRERLDIDSIRVFVVSVNRYFNRLLLNPEARKSLQVYCCAKLQKQKREFFEFSEQSVLSNLYWGVENFEAAVEAKSAEGRAAHLERSEQMLQIPALLDEHESTSGISNKFLICCAYFYLSLVRQLQQDAWQMTLHFLQALLVSPSHIRTKLAPELWELLFLTRVLGENWAPDLTEFREDVIDDATRELARRYKGWMMYYQVILYGETPNWLSGETMTGLPQEEPRNIQSTFFSVETCEKTASTSESLTRANVSPVFLNVELDYPLEPLENVHTENNGTDMLSSSSFVRKASASRSNCEFPLTKADEICHLPLKECSCSACINIQNIPRSDTSISVSSRIASLEESDLEETIHYMDCEANVLNANMNKFASEVWDGRLSAGDVRQQEAPGCLIHRESYEEIRNSVISGRSYSSNPDLLLSILDFRDMDSHSFDNCCMEEGNLDRTVQHNSTKIGYQGNSSTKNLMAHRSFNKENDIEIWGNLEKAVLTLCYSDVSSEISGLWGIFQNKIEKQDKLIKEVILEELLKVISTSKVEKYVRASLSILLVLISENRSIVEDMKRKTSNLYDLASALKRNIHEAAVVMYLLNPSPEEIKDLELLPALVEVTCNSKSNYSENLQFPLMPTTAAALMIEKLVTKFDSATNSLHLAAISSPPVLFNLLKMTSHMKIEESISVSSILVSCMRHNGNCRHYLSQVTPLTAFIHLLRSNDKRAKFTALEYFNEILRIPRSAAASLLHQIRQVGNINIMHALMACIQKTQFEHRILAANLLLQLEIEEGLEGKSIFREEALDVLVEAVASEKNSDMQILSAFILSNLGGTFTWTGEPYTSTWLLNKTGLSSSYYMNMIRDYDWSDKTLQDVNTDAWCSKVTDSVLKIGEPVFLALGKGLQSQMRSVSRDCLITLAWLGFGVSATGSYHLRLSTCQNILTEIVRYLQPGLELEERLIACTCVYNYTFKRGIQNVMDISEGLRESLKRLSSITWMAETLVKITDSVLPKKSHVSCVHTQILEAGSPCNGPINALIYYKGLLCSGHSDGSIRAWDIRGQNIKHLWQLKAHKKPVTCLTLYEPGDCLLSGSTDKTVKVWQMIDRRLESVEVVGMKGPIHRMVSSGQLIFIITTQSRGLKVCDGSRNIKTIFRNKSFTSITVNQCRVLLGCADSSIQVLDIVSNEVQELKAAEKSWWLNKRQINAISVYKDLVYSASNTIHISNPKDRGHNETLHSTALPRGRNILALESVEDFMYINNTTSPSIIEIWLRENQRKVGRISAGSRITALFTANDVLLCGTESGFIKGWVPL